MIMMDNVDAARMGVRTRPVVTLGCAQTLDGRVGYPGAQAMTVEWEEAVGCVTAS